MDEMTINVGRNETTPSKSKTSTSYIQTCTVSIDLTVKRNKFYYFGNDENELRIGKVIEIIDENWITVRWYIKQSEFWPRNFLNELLDESKTNLTPKELIEQAFPEAPDKIRKKLALAEVSVIYVEANKLTDDVIRLENRLRLSGSLDMYVCRYKLIKTTVYQLQPIDYYYDSDQTGEYSEDDRNSIVSNFETIDLRNEIDKLHLSMTECDANEKTNKKDETNAKQVTPFKIIENSVQKIKRRNENDPNDNADDADGTVELSPSKRSKMINDSNQNYLPESPVGPKNNHPTVKSKKMMKSVKKNLNKSFIEPINDDDDDDDDDDNDVFEDAFDAPTIDKNAAQYTASLTESGLILHRSKRPLQENNDNCATQYDTPSKALRNKQIIKIEETGPVTRRRSILKNELPSKKDTPKKSVSLKVDANINVTERNESTPRRQSQRESSKRATALNTAITEAINESPDIDAGKTPRSKRAKSVNKSISDATTPRTTRRSVAFKTPSSSTMTPQQQRKLYRSGNLTPSIQDRELPMKNNQTELEMVRERLHVSAVPQSLPCREKEFDNIYGFVVGKLVDKCGGCIYVSGVPGTGKTATVTQVIRHIQSESKPRKLPAFDYIEINGMRLTEPRQAYVQIYRQLTGKTMAWAQARDLLEERFTRNKKSTRTTILLVDELDIICNRKQDVVYNLFDWTTRKGSCLVAITIANTMDLPERVLKLKVASRLGLTRITFQPYSFKQLQEVVMARLAGSKCFVSDAVQLVARKVASISGDCRRALDICRRATEIAEASTSNNKNHIVNFVHVNQALSEMFASPKVRAIKNCTKSEKLFLQAVASEITRTGIEEVDFYGVYLQISTLAPLLGISNPLTEENAMRVCMTLAQNRLLIAEDSSMGLYQKIILNVSVDDLYYALNNN